MTELVRVYTKTIGGVQITACLVREGARYHTELRVWEANKTIYHLKSAVRGYTVADSLYQDLVGLTSKGMLTLKHPTRTGIVKVQLSNGVEVLMGSDVLGEDYYPSVSGFMEEITREGFKLLS